MKKEKRKWWKKSGKENGVTTDLPPGKSFMFIVYEQDHKPNRAKDNPTKTNSIY
jgi:hypothetical protein